MKRTLKTMLRTILRTCKKVPRKTYINIESNRSISQFIYTVIVVA